MDLFGFDFVPTQYLEYLIVGLDGLGPQNLFWEPKSKPLHTGSTNTRPGPNIPALFWFVNASLISTFFQSKLRPRLLSVLVITACAAHA